MALSPILAIVKQQPRDEPIGGSRADHEWGVHVVKGNGSNGAQCGGRVRPR